MTDAEKRPLSPPADPSRAQSLVEWHSVRHLSFNGASAYQRRASEAGLLAATHCTEAPLWHGRSFVHSAWRPVPHGKTNCEFHQNGTPVATRTAALYAWKLCPKVCSSCTV